jgi:hypothetical protein
MGNQGSSFQGGGRRDEMKFAKGVFWVAGIWSVLIVIPLYFAFDLIGRMDPPPVSRPSEFQR